MTVDALCEHFANDVMSVEEFEKRVDAAHKATSVDQLSALLRDLPGAPVPAVRSADGPPAPRPEQLVTAAAHVRDREYMVAVLGGSNRKGVWSPARRNYAVAVMGGCELDFREARLGPGITELRVFAVWGGIEIIVPPGLNVESQGIGLLGGFDYVTDTTLGDPNAPTLRISGLACMGGVEISVRHPGESAREARRRRRLERRDRKRLHRGD
jgi:hypothetical protein